MMHAEIEKRVCDKFIKSREEDTKLFSFKAFQSQHCFGAGRSASGTGKENQHNKGKIMPQNSKSVFVPIQCSRSFVHISEMFTVLPIKKPSQTEIMLNAPIFYYRDKNRLGLF